ncbi:cobalamin biosynthesis protein CobQ [Pontivivens insulae]|uniref:Phospholipase C/D domain-containing protein n=1 Tax=Pontivivens insulae TaxID=1639689 RepID=A0A2R8AFP7_9RHOB|nr:cobalamin biosynthesis protein CobQ [Pontivivens insulae]RED12307.1 hypothetical protein DFR53_3026 [Pontivivens insulae]SPF31064.1 hypothetical protein POI8812_03415 [Pontivivens insulae]
MNTPAHLIVSAALFARSAEPGSEQRRINRMAIAGGLLPDFTLYFAFIYAVFLRGVTPNTFFGEMYFSSAFQRLFSIDNSFIFWGIGLAAAFIWRSRWAIAFTVSALVHLLSDFLLHHDDARRQFWPLTDWVFESPVSYWDPAHYGNLFGPVEILLCVALLAVLWRRFAGRWARIAIGLGIVTQIAPTVAFAIMFAG